ncbi:MAG: hypothetical protein Q7T82_15140 [Armatimonadota bacterium]|nr:hypothetical protein [Armatimonadota bacterium]
MRVLPRKQQVEGWNEEVEVGRLARLRDNIRDSNRAWVACFVGVVVIGVCLVLLTAHQEQLVKRDVPEPPHREHGIYRDAPHNKFVKDFDAHMKKRGVPTESSFENSGRFKIIVSIDTSSDDIVFMSGAAARAILLRFKNAPYVYVYVRDANESSLPKLICVTRWAARKGDFDIVLHREKEERQY